MNAKNANVEARSTVEGICHFERSEKSSPSGILCLLQLGGHRILPWSQERGTRPLCVISHSMLFAMTVPRFVITDAGHHCEMRSIEAIPFYRLRRLSNEITTAPAAPRDDAALS